MSLVDGFFFSCRLPQDTATTQYKFQVISKQSDAVAQRLRLLLFGLRSSGRVDVATSFAVPNFDDDAGADVDTTIAVDVAGAAVAVDDSIFAATVVVPVAMVVALAFAIAEPLQRLMLLVLLFMLSLILLLLVLMLLILLAVLTSSMVLLMRLMRVLMSVLLEASRLCSLSLWLVL